MLSPDEISTVRYNATRPIWNGYAESIYSQDGTYQRTDTFITVNTEEDGEYLTIFVGTDYIDPSGSDPEATGLDLFIPHCPVGNAHTGTCIIAGATLREVLEKLSSFSDT